MNQKDQSKVPEAAIEEASTALNLIRRECAAHAAPSWHNEVANRRMENPAPIPDDREVMRRFCVAIAYSQGARSAQIGALIQTPIFEEVFAGFDSHALARRQPKRLVASYWGQLGHLRFRGKISRIIKCAKVLNAIIREHGSFAGYLKRFEIPRRICSTVELDAFWRRFDELQGDFRRRKMPFFRSTTSLLQLLLDLDFDSVKPDLIVMRLARRIGIVVRETGDSTFRRCVRLLQAYSIRESCRASEIDIALLAFGGQTGASRLLTQRFCPPSDPCHHRTCPLGTNGLCMAHNFVRGKA